MTVATLFNKPFQQKASQLVRLVAQYSSVQAIVQVLGFVGSLLLVNCMSVSEYATYMIVSTLQGTLMLLADTGLSSALSALAGKHWQDPNRLGQVVQSGLEMRRLLGGAAFLVVIPIIAWTFYKNHVPVVYGTFLATVLLAGAGARMTTDIFSTVLKIKGRVNRLQQLDLIGTGFR